MDRQSLATSIQRSKAAKIADECRQSYSKFVKHFWSAIPGVSKLDWNWHLDVVCQELQDTAFRVRDRLPKQYDTIINISPGTSKSSLCSILYAPWTWTFWPKARHMCASHTEKLVMELAWKSRHVVLSRKYQLCFPDVVLDPAKRAISGFHTVQGGERLTSTVGGDSPTGHHADIIMCDDLIDPAKIVSEAERRIAREFLTVSLSTRQTDKAVTAIFLTMQRLGIGDPTEVLLKEAAKGGAAIHQICLPAELTDDIKPEHLREEYLKHDGLMDPKRLPRNVLNGFKVRNAFMYTTQFLQRPYLQDGSMFKADWFTQMVKNGPYQARRVRACDRAATEDGGCATAGVLMCEYEGSYYVEDMVWGQWEPDERNRIILATAQRDRRKYEPRFAPMILIEREGGSSGKDAYKMLAKTLAGFPAREEFVTGSKDSRAAGWASQCAARNVYLVDNGESRGEGKALWDIDGFIQEHVAFKPEPGSKRLGLWKDRVDACSMAFNYLSKGRAGPVFRTLSFGSKKAKFYVVVGSGDDLASIQTDHKALLIFFIDPPTSQGLEMPPVPHGFTNVIDKHQVFVADIQPSEYIEEWEKPLEPYGQLPEKLILDRETGKKLWAFLLKQRDPAPDLFVFQDAGGEDRRALSAALAVCDTLGFPRTIIHMPGNEERFSSPDNSKSEKPSNQHLYDMVRTTRGMVV